MVQPGRKADAPWKDIDSEVEQAFAIDTGQQKKRPRGRPKKIVKDLGTFLGKHEGQKVVPVYDGYNFDEEGRAQLTMLTPYEHAFAVAYVKTNDAGKAALLAARPEDRKKERRWPKVGYDLLRRDSVRQAIGLMQKKLCVAAALDSTEIISNIRDIAAMALADGKFEAALKANQMLGAYLGVDFGQAGARPGPKPVASQDLQMENIFKSGEELTDSRTDIEKLQKSLGIDISAALNIPSMDKPGE